MTARYIIDMNKPAGMSAKEFKRIVSEIEEVRQMLSYEEKQKCQEVLKLAGIRKENSKGSLNYHMTFFLDELTELAQKAVRLHMKINALPFFLELVLHNELYTLSQKEVDKNKAYILSKGYTEIKEFFQKKVWTADVCKVILISKGVGEKTNKFYRLEAWFRKDEEMPFQESDPVYSQYFRDLII